MRGHNAATSALSTRLLVGSIYEYAAVDRRELTIHDGSQLLSHEVTKSVIADRSIKVLVSALSRQCVETCSSPIHGMRVKDTNGDNGVGSVPTL